MASKMAVKLSLSFLNVELAANRPFPSITFSKKTPATRLILSGHARSVVGQGSSLGQVGRLPLKVLK